MICSSLLASCFFVLLSRVSCLFHTNLFYLFIYFGLCLFECPYNSYVCGCVYVRKQMQTNFKMCFCLDLTRNNKTQSPEFSDMFSLLKWPVFRGIQFITFKTKPHNKLKVALIGICCLKRKFSFYLFKEMLKMFHEKGTLVWKTFENNYVGFDFSFQYLLFVEIVVSHS